MRPPDSIDAAEVYATIPEATFQRHVIELARSLGWDVYSHNTLASRGRVLTSLGWPDLVLCRPPRLIFAELKSAKGQLSHWQREWRDNLRDCSQMWYLWRPADWDEIVEILT